MKRLALTMLLVVLPFFAAAAADDAAPHPMAVTADAVQWGPAPPALPAGAKLAVLAGDPGAEGPFTIRASFPDGYRIAPHWHPTIENLTVISGTFHVGTGDTFDTAKAQALTAGSFASMPATMHHYAWAEGATVVQVHGTGPFQLNYVNAADDPRSQAPAKKE